MGNDSDEEFVIDDKTDRSPSPSDPTPSLLERKDAQKRTASPSVMKECLKKQKKFMKNFDDLNFFFLNFLIFFKFKFFENLNFLKFEFFYFFF